MSDYLSNLGKVLDEYPQFETKVTELLAARKKKISKQAAKQVDPSREDDDGTPVDMAITSEERLYRATVGGLSAPATDSRQYVGRPELSLDLTGGLRVPGDNVAPGTLSAEEAKRIGIYRQLEPLFFDDVDMSLSAEERKHRAIIAKARREGREASGMALPPE